MFIPRDNAVHENLATRYVLLDALVEDLCESRFSGVVEVAFQTGDCHIIIERGRVSAAVDRREGEPPSHTTVALLSARSRAERGSISVYNFPPGAALALSGRITAEPLYKGLSTDFADLEKMLAKLSRERDRYWFIEVRTESGRAALIHLADERCRVITEDGVDEGQGDAQGFAGNIALSRLLEECERAGAHFDVLFKRPSLEEPAALITDPEPAEQEISIEENIIAASVEESAEEEPSPVSPGLDEVQAVEPQLSEPDFIAPVEENYSEVVSYEAADQIDEPEPLHQEAGAAIGPNTRMLFARTSMGDENTEPASEPVVEAATEVGESPSLREDEAMVEIKRLMGEITRIIEEAARTTEPQNKFSMYLRAGQLKVADRYPFLDPFGAEFEYLGGEIAFIGRAAPSDFIAGLTEALKLALTGVAQSSAQPARVRRQIAEDLSRLRSRIGPDLERYDLDKAIDELIQPA